MSKLRLYAALIGVSLGLIGSSSSALAFGHFHHANARQSYSFAAPMMVSPSYTLAAPTISTSAFALTVPTTPVYSFAAPAVAVQPFALTTPAISTQAFSLAPSYSHAATAYTLAPLAVSSNQIHAQALSAAPQFLSEIEAVLGILDRIRGVLNRGGIANPSDGVTNPAGNQPIEVKVTICGEGASPSPAPGNNRGVQTNQPLDDLLKRLGVIQLQSALQASSQPAAAQNLPKGSLEQQLEEINKQLKSLSDEVAKLKQQVPNG